MRGICLVHDGVDAVLRRLAIDYFAEALAEMGYRVQPVKFMSPEYAAAKEWAEVVIFYRVSRDIWHEVHDWRNRKAVTIQHFDDFVFNPCRFYNSDEERTHVFRNFEASDAVSACNRRLLSHMTVEKPKLYRTSCLPERMLKRIGRQPGQTSQLPVVACFAGLSRQSNHDFLADVMHSFDRLDLPVVYRWFSATDGPYAKYGFRNVRLERQAIVPFDTAEPWYDAIARCRPDVVLNFLDETLEFMHCKAHLKYIESGALGSVLLTSRISPFTEDIHEGFNGAFASTKDEFVGKLAWLLSDRERLSRMQANANEDVLNRFNAKTVAKNFLAELRRYFPQLAGRGP